MAGVSATMPTSIDPAARPNSAPRAPDETLGCNIPIIWGSRRELGPGSRSSRKVGPRRPHRWHDRVGLRLGHATRDVSAIPCSLRVPHERRGVGPDVPAPAVSAAAGAGDVVDVEVVGGEVVVVASLGTDGATGKFLTGTGLC